MSEFDADRVRIQVQADPAVSLSVIDTGPHRSSPVLFFVQGAGGHALQWVNQLRHFSQQYRCVAPDLRGHARSDKPRDGYTMDRITRDLVAVLDGLGIQDPIVLLAHSAGGLLGINFAAQYPERLTRLILVNTAASLPLSIWMHLGLRIPSVLVALVGPFLQRRGRFNAPPQIF
jgi:pimeloyl-ACP methyl ester carboxylesterase